MSAVNARRLPHPPFPFFVVADAFFVLFLFILFLCVLFAVFRPSWGPKEKTDGKTISLTWTALLKDRAALF